MHATYDYMQHYSSVIGLLNQKQEMVVGGKNSEKKKNCSKKEQKKNIVKKKTCHLEYVSRPGENGRFEEYHRENHLIRENHRLMISKKS